MDKPRCFWCGHRAMSLSTNYRETIDGPQMLPECQSCYNVADFHMHYKEHRTAMARMLLYLPEPVRSFTFHDPMLGPDPKDDADG